MDVLRAVSHALRGTTHLKPCCMPSSTEARMQPLVEHPIMMQVSTPIARRLHARLVPKKAEGYCFTRTASPSRGAMRSSISTSGLSFVQVRSFGIFWVKMPPSLGCSKYTFVLEDWNALGSREVHQRTRLRNGVHHPEAASRTVPSAARCSVGLKGSQQELCNNTS